MEEIKNYIKEQILSQTQAFEVEFFTYKLQKTLDNRERLIINCHYQEEDIKLLDLFDQGQLYRVNDIERVKKFSRINAAITFFISCPFFVKTTCFESIATGFFYFIRVKAIIIQYDFIIHILTLMKLKIKNLDNIKICYLILSKRAVK